MSNEELSSLPDWIMKAGTSPKIIATRDLYKVVIKDAYFARSSKNKDMDCFILQVTDGKYSLPVLIHTDTARDIVTPKFLPVDIPMGYDMDFFCNKLMEVQRSGVTVWNRKGVAYPLLIALDWTCDLKSDDQQIPDTLLDISENYKFARFNKQLPKKDDPEYEELLKSSGIIFRKFNLKDKRGIINTVVNQIYDLEHVGFYTSKEEQKISSLNRPRMTSTESSVTTVPTPPSIYTAATVAAPNESNSQRDQKQFLKRKRPHEAATTTISSSLYATPTPPSFHATPTSPSLPTTSTSMVASSPYYMSNFEKHTRAYEAKKRHQQKAQTALLDDQSYQQEAVVTPMEIDQEPVRNEAASTPIDNVQYQRKLEDNDGPKCPEIEMYLEEQNAILWDKESTPYERSVALSRFQRLVYFHECQFVVEPL